MIFKVALIVLGSHEELLLQCDGFEAIIEFLKDTLPTLGIIQMENVINKVRGDGRGRWKGRGRG